jgi:uroporphyrinogen-III synthase
VIFTSPSAVRFAIRLRMWQPDAMRPYSPQRAFALGQATAGALRRAGIHCVEIPEQATSEGLLALRELRALKGKLVGVVTAPGGRGLLAERLRARGAKLAIAEVYARTPARLNRGHVQRLLDARGRGAVCVTSGEALRNVLAALPDAARKVLLDCVAVVSSIRLEAVAREAGFQTVVRALAPTPRDLIEALHTHASEHRFR